MYLENLAAESDYRTTCIDEKWWKSINGTTAIYHRWYTDEDGNLCDEENARVSIRFEVCPACDGRGKYVNPSIDAHGLTRDDFDEDPDFAESYFRGDYDVRCRLCDGEKVIPVPTDNEILEEIKERQEENYRYRQEQLAEIRAGC